jgi:hypothetical protein
MLVLGWVIKFKACGFPYDKDCEKKVEKKLNNT